MVLVVPLFTEIGLRRLARGLLGSGIKLSFLRKNGSQGLLGALQRVLAKIMFVLQVVPGFSDRLWGGCAALYGAAVPWQGISYLCKGTGSQRGLYAGLQRASINGNDWRCVVSALLVSELSRKGSMWP